MSQHDKYIIYIYMIHIYIYMIHVYIYIHMYIPLENTMVDPCVFF